MGCEVVGQAQQHAVEQIPAVGPLLLGNGGDDAVQKRREEGVEQEIGGEGRIARLVEDLGRDGSRAVRQQQKRQRELNFPPEPSFSFMATLATTQTAKPIHWQTVGIS